MTATAEAGVDEQFFAEQQSRLGFAGEMALKIGGAVLAGAAILTPPAVGALVGAERPVHVDFAPGLSADANVRFSHTTDVDLGLLGGAVFPAVHKHFPVIGDVAGEVQVGPASIPDFRNKEEVALYSALFDNPAKTIEQPLVGKIKANAVRGALYGAGGELIVAGGILGGLAYSRRRQQKRQEKVEEALEAHEAALEAAGAGGPDVTESLDGVRKAAKPETPGRSPRRRLIAAAASLAVVAAGTGIMAHETQPPSSQPAASTVALDGNLAKLSPLLAGARIYGSGAEYAINTGANVVLEAKTSIDKSEQGIAANITQLVAQRKAEGRLPYIGDPRYKVEADVSDIHCNLAYLKYVLPVQLHEFGVTTLINTGDTDVSTGSLPFESQCVARLADAMRPTPQYPWRILSPTVMGNHDSQVTANAMRQTTLRDTEGKEYHPFVVLDKQSDFVSEVNGVWYVGSSDPRQSVVLHAIVPTSSEAQHTVVAKQGAALAQVAQKVMEKTGARPTLLSHDPLAGYASLAHGYVDMTTAGHLHIETLYRNFDGAYAFTQGTSSGAGDDQFTEYATPKKAAPITFVVRDTATNERIGYYNLVTYPDLHTELSDFTPMPSKPDPALPSRILNFLQIYDPETASVVETYNAERSAHRPAEAAAPHAAASR